jgi:hypothetical protein
LESCRLKANAIWKFAKDSPGLEAHVYTIQIGQAKTKKIYFALYLDIVMYVSGSVSMNNGSHPYANVPTRDPITVSVNTSKLASRYHC